MEASGATAASAGTAAGAGTAGTAAGAGTAGTAAGAGTAGTAATSVTAGAAATAPGELPAAPLVLYDGNCGLCARSVRWLLDHERDRDLVFAPLQGPTGALARERYPHIPASVDTVVYVSDGRAHLRSKAFLHAARHLRAPWRWGYVMRWFPGFVLDVAYRLVAALRYRIWGHADACGLVTPEQRRRFLP